jgi:hypothetical protein
MTYWWTSAAAAVLLALVACQPLAPAAAPLSTDRADRPVVTALGLADHRPAAMACGVRFGRRTIAQAQPGAEHMEGPLFDQLRRLIDDHQLPIGGWRLVIGDHDRLLALAPSDDGWACAHVAQTDGRVTARSDPSNAVRSVPSAGMEPAGWTLSHPPNAATDTITVKILPRGCSLAPSVDRLAAPLVEYTETAVILTIALIAPPNMDVSCRTHTPLTAVVRLPEPIGDRVLMDGSTYPPTVVYTR